MLVHSKTRSETKDNLFLDYFKGLLVSILLSLELIVLFALLLKWFDIADGFIVPMTLIIKGVSVFVGACIAIKGDSKGLVKGVIFGALYIALAFLIFGMLAGTFKFSVSGLLDVVFACVLGGLVGIVKVNRH